MVAKNPDDVRMSLGEHLEDLRYRLLLGLSGPFVIALVALYYGDNILAWLMQPALVALQSQHQPAQLINTDALSPFTLYMKVSFMTGLIFGIPWLFFQLWQFIAPGLYPHERKLVYKLIPGSVLLTTLGVLFMYYIMLPLMLYFLVGFALAVPMPSLDKTGVQQLLFNDTPIVTTENIPPAKVPLLTEDPKGHKLGDMWVKLPESELRINIGTTVLRARLGLPSPIAPTLEIGQYLGLVSMLAIAFALSFQLPLVLLVLGWVGVFSYEQLARSRRYSLLACVILAAVITPTADPFSLFLMTAPLYLLYEFGVFLVWWMERGKKEDPTAEVD